MGDYKFLFGPVPSRRLGRSLGVDLIPYKTCSLDCIFCQLGRTTFKTVDRKDYVSTSDVIAEIKDWIATDGRADYITLSGSGEPTLHLHFEKVLEFIRANTRVPTALLTNGAMLHIPEVRDAACQAHVVKISLSAWDQASYEWINRPHSDLTFDQLIKGQKAFRTQFKGEMWMEVFLVAGMNSTPSDVRKISALAKEIRPDRIHLNTAVRPPAEDFVVPLSGERLESLAHLFYPKAHVIADFQANQSVEMHATQEDVYSMLQRRPCTAKQIAESFGMHLNEVSKYLGKLLHEKRIHLEQINRSTFYLASCAEESQSDRLRSPIAARK